MEQLSKRLKVTKEATIEDSAACIRDIAASFTSISESYRALLKLNNAVVAHIHKANVNTLRTDLEQTKITED